MSGMSAIAKVPYRNGSNQLKPYDKPVHDWFRFVLSFPPHLVQEYLSRFNVNKRQRVLDPFCGTGTTVVECKKNRFKSVGLETNPVVSFYARTKVDWTPDASGLIDHARRVADVALRRLQDLGMSDNGDLPLLSTPSNGNHGEMLMELPEEEAGLLIRNSISPIPLHKSLELLRAIEELKDDRFYNHERLAYAKVIVFSASNLHFGPEVGVSRKKKHDAPVISAWLNSVLRMAEDLRNVGDRKDVESVVHEIDARKLSRALRPQSVNAVITSPPYPNEKDYTRTTRLESVLLGYVSSKADLRSLKQNLVRSNTRGRRGHIYTDGTQEFGGEANQTSTAGDNDRRQHESVPG